MKTDLMRTAAAFLLAALAFGAMLPGEVAAKPFGKPPIYKPLPPGYFKKKIDMSCQIVQLGQQRKARVTNTVGYALPAGTKVFWRGTGGRSGVGGIFSQPLAFYPGGHVDFNVPSTITGCYAWIMVSIIT